MKETYRQLQKMEDLLGQYPEIAVNAAKEIYDWLDGINVFARAANWDSARKTREEQADELIGWFEERIQNRGTL